MAFNEIYKGKRVLVTGHTGFKGSWLSLWLSLLGAEVYGIALAPRTENDHFLVSRLGSLMDDNRCDIRDRSALGEHFKRIRPEIVFHLAAQALVKNSFDNPADTYMTNLMGTVHVLEAMRQTPDIRCGIFITSDKCYKNVEWEWGYRETDELGGLDPYGASKACAELAIQSHRESFFKTPNSPVVASVRAGNVIGGGDWSEKRIVPDIIRALMAGKPAELRSPQATRPWQFVLEPLSGYLWLGARMFAEGDLSNGWNFGPEIATIVTVGELTQKLIKRWGQGSMEDMSGDRGFHEATLLSLDISKARYRLQWRPTLNLDETVDYTAGWYQAFVNREDLQVFSKDQIAGYTRKALERGVSWAN